MAVIDQKITDRYAIYNGDSIEIMAKFPNECMHLSVYSPPFGGLYHYSSSERDLSNCPTYEGFFDHYRFMVREIARIAMPGRISAVHTSEVPSGNTGSDYLRDFPGDVIRLHAEEGFDYIGRRVIWKEPLWVRNRTLQKNLAHKTIVDDSTLSGVASADYLLMFRRKGKNKIPVAHPTGLLRYAGSRKMPAELLRYRGHKGKQTGNRYSHWIWRQYASSVWDDIRMGNVLPFREAKDTDDEKHVHALQKDVIERCCVLETNPGERVWTPCAGVGSEVAGAMACGRLGIGGELKESYYRQAVKNLDHEAEYGDWDNESTEQTDLFDEGSMDDSDMAEAV